ncbi:unnamed protein product [Durusdinium trenchii]|uniref:RNase H type-1 domain-containing protein n=1 Tax=Durusdinium trenchii TaxID=1381693 RepID=A0ABP0SHE3_9DINO
MKPAPVCSLRLEAYSGCHTTQRWVRSPWKIQAELLTIPAGIDLGEVGASFVAASQMNTSLTVHCGSTLFDPAIKTHEVGLADTLSFRLAPLKGGMPGADHSPYRGEVWAILLALQRVWAPRFFTDCSAVVSLLQQMLMDRQLGLTSQACKHWDLWELWTHILRRPVGAVTITKVSSHTQWWLAPSEFDSWCGRWNDTVDKTAKRVLTGTRRDLLDKLTSLFHDAERNAALLFEFHQYWTAASCGAMSQKDDGQQSAGSVPDIEGMYMQQGGVCPLARVQWCADVDAPFGATFSERFFRLFQRVSLNPGGGAEESSSLLELYISFALDTRTMAPVYFPSLKKKTASRP